MKLPVTASVAIAASATSARSLRRDEWQPPLANLRCLYVAEERNWQGDSTLFCTDHTVNECNPKMERHSKSWTNIISSAGANNNSLCRLYSQPDCAGSSVVIDYPGYADLSTINFENKAVSLRCADTRNTTSVQARPRSPGLRCMYMTNEVNWRGEGLVLCTEPGQCAGQLPDGLATKVMSAGASEDSRCYLYSDKYCTGNRSTAIPNGGYADLNIVDFASKAQSFLCNDVNDPVGS